MPEAAATRNGRRSLVIGIGVLAGLALVTLVYWALFMRGIVSTNDARFAGDLVDIAPQISGTLARVDVDEGDTVTAGQPLFQLDLAALTAAAARADAEAAAASAAVQVAEADLEKSVRGPLADEIRRAAAAEARTRAEAELARTNLERLQRVFAAGGLSESERDRARTARDTARQQHEEAAAQLALLEGGTRQEDLQAARHRLEAARAQSRAAAAAARLAHVHLEQAQVGAPFAGIVVKRWLDPGAAVAASRPVLTLLDPASLHVAANVEEKQLDHLAVGDPVAITVDAYPELKLGGHLATIGRATNSQFSVVPAEGVSGTFIKVAQRVPLCIRLDSQPERPLSPGLSVEVKIDTRGSGTGNALAVTR